MHYRENSGAVCGNSQNRSNLAARTDNRRLSFQGFLHAMATGIVSSLGRQRVATRTNVMVLDEADTCNRLRFSSHAAESAFLIAGSKYFFDPRLMDCAALTDLR